MKDFILTFLAVVGSLFIFIVMPIASLVVGSMGYTITGLVMGFFTICGMLTVLITLHN